MLRKRITFHARGEPLALEGILYRPDDSLLHPAAILCHPHPLYGGTMDNLVVVHVARALLDRGLASLRFNFRGVGGSEGRFAEGEGELNDAGGALDWLRAQPGIDWAHLYLVGYSFGAWVALRYAVGDEAPSRPPFREVRRDGASDERIQGYVGIGFPAWRMLEPPTPPDAAIRAYTRPKLFLTGDADELTPLPALRDFVAGLAEPKTLHVLRAADHFFTGRTQEVGEIVGDFLAGLAV
jgi:alpha/beta superfamily hydrolase